MKKILFLFIIILAIFCSVAFADHVMINPSVVEDYRGSIFSNEIFAIVFTCIIIVFITFTLYKIFNIKEKPENKKPFYSVLILVLIVIGVLVFYSVKSPIRGPIYLGGIGDYLVFDENSAEEINVFNKQMLNN